MSARFGGDLPDKGLLMRLDAADPRWACGPVTPKDPALGPTALLIERGGPPNQPCAFAYKVRDISALNCMPCVMLLFHFP